MSSMGGLAFGLLDLRRFIDPHAPAYSTEKEASYRRSLKKSRAESEFDENKQTIFVPEEDERVSRMPTEDDVMEFDTEIAFDDDAAWDAVPRAHRRGRFAQYRNLARANLAQTAEQARQRSDRKILQLKSRFNDFKAQWDEERNGLEMSVREAERETEDAKRKAELAVRKLEELYERFKETQSLSNADSGELQSRIGQLHIDKTQLETRVEELDHEVRVLNQLLKQAAKEKEDAEARLAAAAAASSTVHEPAVSRSRTEDQDPFADIRSEEEASSVDIPFPEDTLLDGGPGLHLADHPIVSEFMRTYNHIMKSKTRLSELLSENDAYKEVASNLNSLGQEGLMLDRDNRITPQIEDLGRNLTFVSDQIFLLVENVILSLQNLRHQQPHQQQQQQQSSKSASKTEAAVAKERHDELMKQIEDLKSKYTNVGRLMQEKESKFQTDLAERDAEIRELQQSVAQLQSEVSRLRAEQQVDLQNSLMFTKLDAERNTKTLKRALASRRIGEAAYETAVEAMEEYASVPAKRLLTMARRLLHRRTVEQLQTAVLSGDELTEERARLLLARLEDFDARAGRRYDLIMDRLREERLRLARGLVDTFEDVGESCSLFLIRPVLSLKHRENLEQHYRTVVERNRRAAAQRRSEDELQAFSRGRGQQQQQQQRLSPCPEEATLDSSRRLPDVAGAGVRHDTSLTDVWNIHASTDMRILPAGFDRTLLNTPRLLEMDVNKILLGQNRISASLDAEATGGLRYYVPLKRRSMDNFSTSMHELGAPPPTTPAPGKQQTQAAAASGPMISHATTTPLPPIKSKTHS